VYDEGHGNTVLRDAFIDVTLGVFFLGRSRSSNFRSSWKRNPCVDRPSGKRSRTGLYGQSIEKIFQCLLSGLVRRAMRPEAAFP